MDNVKVSIIIPMYNAEKYITDCLNSVFNQTYPNYEVIVIDDNSQDQSVSLVQTFQTQHDNLILLRNDTNYGVATTRNLGIQQATGQWIAFLDADDMWLPEKLNQQINALQTHQAQLCYTSQIFYDDDGKPTKKKFLVKESIDYRSLLKQNLICLSSAIIKKELCVKYPFHHANLHEDFIFWLEILRHEKIKTIGLIEPLTIYRLTKQSKTRNKFKSLIMTYRTYRHLGLNFFQACYYLLCYIVNGIKKYH